MTEDVGCLRSEAQRNRVMGQLGVWAVGPFQFGMGGGDQATGGLAAAAATRVSGEQMSHRSAFVPRVARPMRLANPGAGFVRQQL